jgi:hypothetical protein
VLWNLQTEPDAYLAALQEFCTQQKLDDEARIKRLRDLFRGPPATS